MPRCTAAECAIDHRQSTSSTVSSLQMAQLSTVAPYDICSGVCTILYRRRHSSEVQQNAYSQVTCSAKTSQTARAGASDASSAAVSTRMVSEFALPAGIHNHTLCECALSNCTPRHSARATRTHLISLPARALREPRVAFALARRQLRPLQARRPRRGGGKERLAHRALLVARQPARRLTLQQQLRRPGAARRGGSVVRTFPKRVTGSQERGQRPSGLRPHATPSPSGHRAIADRPRRPTDQTTPNLSPNQMTPQAL